MSDYQMRLKDEGEWRNVTRWELRKRLKRCVLDVEQQMKELDSGKVFSQRLRDVSQAPGKTQRQPNTPSVLMAKL